MNDGTKVSELPEVVPAEITESMVFYVVVNGISKKMTLAQLKAWLDSQ